jgi:hypothetical protein
MESLKYLTGYPVETLRQVQEIVNNGRLGKILLKKYPKPHEIRTDKQLYEFTMDIKSRYLGKTQPLKRVIYDSKIKVIQHALGQHHFITKVQGNKTRTVNEIKIASIFKNSPEAFLNMITVHELSHFREKEHNKSFYQLCRHMQPQYHEYEFDLRLYLTYLNLHGELYT